MTDDLRSDQAIAEAVLEGIRAGIKAALKKWSSSEEEMVQEALKDLEDKVYR